MGTKKIIGILFCICGLLLSLNTIRITGNVVGFSEYFNSQMTISILVFLFGAFLLFTESLEAKVDDAGEFAPLTILEKYHIEQTSRPFIEELVQNLHDKQYKAVFLTQTSSIPYGFMVKEAYRIKYPGEKAPRFLTIDVKGVRSSRYSRNNPKLLADNLIKKTAEKMRKYKISEGDRVILLDEKIPDRVSEGLSSVDTERKRLISETKQKYDSGGTAGIAYHILEDAYKENGFNPHVDFDFIVGEGIRDQYRCLSDCTARPKNLFHNGIAGWTHAIRGGVEYSRRWFGKKERQISKENIQFLKEVARLDKKEAHDRAVNRWEKYLEES